MKTIKYLFAGALSLLMMTAFTSCSEDEASYTPAQPVSGDQVFFPSSNVSAIDLTEDATSFDVTIARVDTTKAADIALTCTSTDNLGLFTLPTSVHFEKGESSTTVSIGYDAEQIINTIGYAAYNDIEIAIADEASSTPYGIAKYVVSVGVPEPWSEWELYGEGTGTYFYSLYWGGEDPERPVYYRKYLLDETTAQFKIEGVMYGIDMIIDYNIETGACKVPVQNTGYLNSNYGYVYFSDCPSYPLQPGLTYEQYPCSFDKEAGLFSLNLVYFVSEALGATASGMFANGVETFQLDGYTVYDYSVALNYVGIYNTPNGDANAVAQVTLGADAENAVVAMVEGKDVNAALTALISGELEGQTVEENGYVAFPIEASGTYSFVAVTYLEGDVMEYNYATFDAYVGGGSPYDDFVKASVEDYVGNWIIPGEYKGEATETPISITSIEEEGVTYLLVKGAGGAFGAQLGYDDEFFMVYDAETGLVTLPAQNMAKYNYEGTDYQGMQLYYVLGGDNLYNAGSLVGGITEDGTIKFLNGADNELTYDSFVVYINGLTVVSDYLYLTWMPVASEEGAAAAPAVRGAKRSFDNSKKIVKAVRSGLTLQQF